MLTVVLLVLVLIAIARAPHGGGGQAAVLALPGLLPGLGFFAAGEELRAEEVGGRTTFAILSFFACLILVVPYAFFWSMAENGSSFT